LLPKLGKEVPIDRHHETPREEAMVEMEEIVVGAMEDQEMDLTPDRQLPLLGLHLVVEDQVEEEVVAVILGVIRPLDGLHTFQEVKVPRDLPGLLEGQDLLDRREVLPILIP
jgi:hypothetical protein